jgi:X-Pro dipeptidyl-peptidase
VPVQSYYHQGGHGGAPPLELMNRWFTRYLYDVQNGVENDPKSWIVREGAERGAPTPYPDYPHPEAAMVKLHPVGDGQGVGSLSFSPVSGAGTGTVRDNVSFTPAQLAAAEWTDHRLLYATPVLTDSVHISGTARVTVRLTSSKPAANLSVYLVQLPYTEEENQPTSLITRGWADPQNHRSLTRGEPLVTGQYVTVTFDLQPDDQVIPSGKRMALMILSSDRGFTLWPTPGTELTVDLTATTIEIPVVGGPAALKRATGQPIS